MTLPDSICTALHRGPGSNPAEFLTAAGQALSEGHAASVATAMAAATLAAPGEPRYWQFLGLAQRALQNSAEANQAFLQAARLAPEDPLIAHSAARSALEAGYSALAEFNRARLLAPSDGSVVLGRIAAMLAEGQGRLACEQLAALLVSSPGWTEGHIALARLAAQVDSSRPLDASLRQALAEHPGAGALWQARFQVLMEGRNFAAAAAAADEARAALGPGEELDRIEAICWSEQGNAAAAQAVFNTLPLPLNAKTAIWPIRNFIRLGRYDEAALLAEREFGTDNDAALWPYRALLWRLLDDPRWRWLEGDPRLIQTYDIAPAAGPLDGLALILRSLHRTQGAPLDQSVRGGTQTDGNFLARAEPELRQLRCALLDAVHDYVTQLPPSEPGHPTLLARREPLTVAGAWSVRLSDEGYHADHVHTQGWISSACYITVPAADPAFPESGWLAFGECRDLVPELVAFRTEPPIPGKLVLFPSIMWHGTRPFESGERMTVAFDIARPPQG